MAKKPFKNATALLRFALICAIRDRETYAECDTGPDGDEARGEAQAFRAYLKQRFGARPHMDVILETATTVSIHELSPRAKFGGPADG